MYGILKPSVFWKIWRRGSPNFISGGVSDGLDPALLTKHRSSLLRWFFAGLIRPSGCLGIKFFARKRPEIF